MKLLIGLMLGAIVLSAAPLCTTLTTYATYITAGSCDIDGYLFSGFTFSNNAGGLTSQPTPLTAAGITVNVIDNDGLNQIGLQFVSTGAPLFTATSTLTLARRAVYDIGYTVTKCVGLGCEHGAPRPSLTGVALTVMGGSVGGVGTYKEDKTTVPATSPSSPLTVLQSGSQTTSGTFPANTTSITVADRLDLKSNTKGTANKASVDSFENVFTEAPDAVVPEPASLLLVGGTLLALAQTLRRRKK